MSIPLKRYSTVFFVFHNIIGDSAAWKQKLLYVEETEKGRQTYEFLGI